MRVVMIGPFGLRRKSTMRLRALPLARALVRRGHQVTVLLPPWDSPADAGRSWVEAGVGVVNVDLPPGRPLSYHLQVTWRLVGQALAVPRPQVVHAFKPKAYAGLSAAALWLLRRLGRADLRLVVDTDDWEGPGGWNEIEPYPPAQRAFFAWQERWGLTHCDAVTVASRALETLVWGMGVEPARVFYVPNGVDRSEPAGKAGERSGGREAGDGGTVLLYTRFVEFQVPHLIEIWQRVAEDAPDARLVVVGEGLRGEEQTLLARIRGAGLERSVIYLGWPGWPAMPGLLAAADLAIMPFQDTLVNRTKCSARLLELMAAGLPVVADAVGQNWAYIEPGVSGHLVPAGEAEAFARAVVGLLADGERRRRMGVAAARRVAERFTWDRLAETVERAYRGSG